MAFSEADEFHRKKHQNISPDDPMTLGVMYRTETPEYEASRMQPVDATIEAEIRKPRLSMLVEFYGNNPYGTPFPINKA